jgi:hypothetical protein
MNAHHHLYRVNSAMFGARKKLRSFPSDMKVYANPDKGIHVRDNALTNAS